VNFRTYTIQNGKGIEKFEFDNFKVGTNLQSMLLSKLLLWQPLSGLPNLFPVSPGFNPSPSCKHIWDTMVGLVSAYGGKFGYLVLSFKIT